MLSKTYLSLSILAASSMVAVVSGSNLVVFGGDYSDTGNFDELEGRTPSPSTAGYLIGPLWDEYLAYYNDYTLIDYSYQYSVSNNTLNGYNMLFFYPGTLPGPTVTEQINKFSQTFGGKFGTSALDSDIVVIDAPPFDYDSTYSVYSNSTNSIEAAAAAAANSMVENVGAIRRLGYKKILVTTHLDSTWTYDTFGSDDKYIALKKKFLKLINAKLSSAVSNNFSNGQNDFVRIVDFDRLIDVLFDQLAGDVGITKITETCMKYSDKKTTYCEDPDNYIFYEQIPTTKVNAIMGLVAAEIIKDSSFTIDRASILPLLTKYNIAAANTKSNFMYAGDIPDVKSLNIKQYKVSSAVANAQEIIDASN